MAYHDSDPIENMLYEHQANILSNIRRSNSSKIVFESSLKLAEMYWKKSRASDNNDLILSQKYLELSNMVDTYMLNKTEDSLLASSKFLEDDLNQMKEQKSTNRSKINDIAGKINYTPKNKATSWNEIESYYRRVIMKDDLI